MIDENRVEVRIGGRRYAGWKSVKITMGIEQVARAFAMSVTEKFPGSTDFGAFRTGELVQVYIGEDLVCTGYIDHTPISYNGKAVSVQISGRSRTGDLVDCCPPSAAYAAAPTTVSWPNVKDKSGNARRASSNPATSWQKMGTADIIAELAKPYGITVDVQTAIGEKVVNHTVNPGEKVIDSINRLITKDNLVVMDDEKGNLVIVEPGEGGKCVDALILGENILSGKADFNAEKLFSKYVVLGQHSGTDDSFGKNAAEDKGVAVDAEVKRFRLNVIKDSGQSSNKVATDRAVFEFGYARARYHAASYTVNGWRQSDGSLWRPNMLVRVDDAVFKLKEELLIFEVVYDLSASGSTCQLKVMSVAGFKSKKSTTSDTKSTSGTTWNNVK